MWAYHGNSSSSSKENAGFVGTKKTRSTRLVGSLFLSCHPSNHHTMDIEQFFKNCRNVLDAHVNARQHWEDGATRVLTHLALSICSMIVVNVLSNCQGIHISRNNGFIDTNLYSTTMDRDITAQSKKMIFALHRYRSRVYDASLGRLKKNYHVELFNVVPITRRQSQSRMRSWDYFDNLHLKWRVPIMRGE